MAQGFLKPSFENLQRGRLHGIYGQATPLWTVPVGKKVSLYIWSELVLFQCIPTVSHVKNLALCCPHARS